MMHIYENVEAVEQLADMDFAEELERRREMAALIEAISDVSDPLLRQILSKIAELIA